MSGSSAFSKSSLNRILSITLLACEMSAIVKVTNWEIKGFLDLKVFKLLQYSLIC